MRKLTAASIILTLFLGGNAFAMQYSLRPTVGTSVTWSDNIDGTSSDEISDFYFSPFAGIDFSAQSKKLSYGLSALLEGRFYFKNDQNNDVGIPGINGDFSYNFTKRLQFSTSSYFRYVPSDSSFQEPISQAVAGTGETITTLITGRTDRLDFSINPSISYEFSRRLSTTVGAGYYTLQFSKNPNQDLTDSNTYSGNVQTDYIFSKTFTGGISLNYSKTDFVQGGISRENDTQVYEVTLTGSYRYLENASLDYSLGAARVSEKNQSSENNFVGSVSTEFNFKTYSVFLGISSYISGVRSSFGNSTENQSLRASFSTNPTKKTDINIAGGLTRQRSVFEDTDNFLIGSLSFRFDYNLLRELSVFISGETTKQDAKGGPVNDIDINTVVIGFELGHTIRVGKSLRGLSF